MPFVAGPQSHHARKEGQKSRSQRNRGFIDPTIGDSDRIAGDAFEDLHSGDRVGHVRRENPLDESHRWEQSIGPVHGAFPVRDFGDRRLETLDSWRLSTPGVDRIPVA
jgi:hypothetical protein